MDSSSGLFCVNMIFCAGFFSRNDATTQRAESYKASRRRVKKPRLTTLLRFDQFTSLQKTTIGIIQVREIQACWQIRCIPSLGEISL